MRILWIILPVLLFAGLAEPGQAHSMRLFAWLEGNEIAGEAYIAGGDPVAHATIEITDADGNPLTSVETDAEGRFRTKKQTEGAHFLTLKTADGHGASFEIPGGGSASSNPPSVGVVPPTASDSEEDPPSGIPLSPRDTQELTNQVQGLNRQVTQLRRDINHYESKVRVHDIIGGIGYIVGLAGLAFFLTTSRSKNPEK